MLLDIFGSHISIYHLNIKTDKKTSKAIDIGTVFDTGSSDVDIAFCSQCLSDCYKELDQDSVCFLSSR